MSLYNIHVHEIICDFADSAIPPFQSSEYRLPLAEIATYKTSRHSYIFPEAEYCAPKSFTFMEVRVDKQFIMQIQCAIYLHCTYTQ